MSLSSVDLVKYHFDNMFFNNPKHIGPFIIKQFGEIDVLPGYHCEEHLQSIDEITYIVSGTALFICDGEQFTVRAGNVIFSPKGSLHEIKAINNSSARYYYIAFEINDLSKASEVIIKEHLSNKPPFTATSDRSIVHAFHEIFLNFKASDEFSEAIISDSIRKILVYTIRAISNNENVTKIEDYHEKNRTLSAICSYIDENAEDINILKKLPQKFGYSYSYISSVFSKSTGISLKEYHILARHKIECELLKQGKSITNVAETMGYSSIHAFSHAFTAREGISPKAYKDKERN